MDLPSLSGAATAALAAALLFVVFVRGWQVAIGRYRAAPGFSGMLMNEAAQRVRDEWSRSGRRQSRNLAAGLVFAIVFATVCLHDGGPYLGGLPAWQSVVLLVIAGLAIGVGVFRLARLTSARRQLRLQRDAGLVTGYALQKLNGNLNRAFHDVPCAAGIVDHVVTGLHGIYAIHVVGRRPGKDNHVALNGDELTFGSRHVPVSIAPFVAIARRFERECSKAVLHDVRVRCVISVPGWETSAQTRNDVLLVNERNLSMLTGWRDPRDYLMNEDVDVLQQMLSERCTRADARN